MVFDYFPLILSALVDELWSGFQFNCSEKGKSINQAAKKSEIQSKMENFPELRCHIDFKNNNAVLCCGHRGECLED